MRACIPTGPIDVMAAGLATGDPQLSLGSYAGFQRPCCIALGLHPDPGLDAETPRRRFEGLGPRQL